MDNYKVGVFSGGQDRKTFEQKNTGKKIIKMTDHIV